MNVIGTASSILLQSYELQYRFVDSTGSAAWTTFASNNVAVQTASLGTLDPTLLLNGQYELRLIATDTLGRTAATDPISITVDRKMKVGNFSVAFSDLNIPLLATNSLYVAAHPVANLMARWRISFQASGMGDI